MLCGVCISLCFVLVSACCSDHHPHHYIRLAAPAAVTARCTPQSVPNNVAGTVMALDMSLSSGLRTVSPLIGTALVQRHGFQGVCVTAAAVLLTTFSAANHLQAPKSKAAGAAHDGGGSGGEDVASVRAQGSTARSPDEKKTD